MKTKRQYFYNALLMTAVALLMRTVTVSFNVYVSNRVGAEAMGLLSLIGSIYGFAVTLATSGIHLATVRTVAEALERCNPRFRCTIFEGVGHNCWSLAMDNERLQWLLQQHK